MITLIGIDCATKDEKIGVALGEWRSNSTSLIWAEEREDTTALEHVCDWINKAKGKVVIALDAPLGWPKDLPSALRGHMAGEPVGIPPDLMFKRETDRDIRRRLGARPLEVGADRIARTAHAALKMLDELARSLAKPIPLAWSCDALPMLSAIEVYPAATLKAHGLRFSGYKRKEDEGARREVVAGLRPLLGIRCPIEGMVENADALDAAVCVLAAGDFLGDGAVAPQTPTVEKLARREGWIWAAEAGTPGSKRSPESSRGRRA